MLIAIAYIHLSVYIEAGKSMSMLTTPSAGKSNRPILYLQSLFLTLILNLVYQANCQALCISTTAHNGSVFSNNYTAGNFAFSNTARAGTSNNQYASARALALLFNGSTEYLKVTGFDFSVPMSAIICGVTMGVERHAQGITLFATVTDDDIRLVKNGAMTGNNQARTTEKWTGTDVMANYGSTTSTWGTFLTPQDVNNAQFGIAISSKINGLAGVLPSAQIDYVNMTVYYSMPNVLPLVITNFKTTAHKNTVTNTWHIMAEEKSSDITLQRSSNGYEWEAVSYYKHAERRRYTHTEPVQKKGTYHFRLQVRTVDNKIHYSEHNKILYNPANAIRIHPNPATTAITVENIEGETISVYNSFGQKLALPITQSQGTVQINIRRLQKRNLYTTGRQRFAGLFKTIIRLPDQSRAHRQCWPV